MEQYINKNDLVAEIESLWKHYLDAEEFDFGWNQALDKVRSYLNFLEVKEVDLEKIIEQTYHDRSVTDTDDMGHVTYENIARYFFELGLKQSSSDEYKLGETEIYLDDDGGEPPYDGKQWLDLSCTEYEIPSDKFKDGDNVEIIIRKTQKRE